MESAASPFSSPSVSPSLCLSHSHFFFLSLSLRRKPLINNLCCRHLVGNTRSAIATFCFSRSRCIPPSTFTESLPKTTLITLVSILCLLSCSSESFVGLSPEVRCRRLYHRPATHFSGFNPSSHLSRTVMYGRRLEYSYNWDKRTMSLIGTLQVSRARMRVNRDSINLFCVSASCDSEPLWMPAAVGPYYVGRDSGPITFTLHKSLVMISDESIELVK